MKSLDITKQGASWSLKRYTFSEKADKEN